MLTKGETDRFKRSLDLFLRQTWPRKEIVVVTDRDPARVRAHLAELRRPEIRLLEVPRAASRADLGRVQQAGMDAAQGDVLCQWDDDDLCHPTRIAAQYEYMETEGAEASYLVDLLHWFEPTGELYWQNWDGQVEQGHPGTLMCRRSVNAVYPILEGRASDWYLQKDLLQRCRVANLRGKPYLYTYVYHGGNTFGLEDQYTVVRRVALTCDGVEARRAALPELSARLREYVPEVNRLWFRDGGTATLGELAQRAKR
jgi:glycosyltransferase involved in cell wall biosynthesis